MAIRIGPDHPLIIGLARRSPGRQRNCALTRKRLRLTGSARGRAACSEITASDTLTTSLLALILNMIRPLPLCAALAFALLSEVSAPGAAEHEPPPSVLVEPEELEPPPAPLDVARSALLLNDEAALAGRSQQDGGYQAHIAALRGALSAASAAHALKLQRSGEPARAARVHALVHAIDDQPKALLDAAAACEQANLPRVALGLYERLAALVPGSPSGAVAARAAAGLRTKLGASADSEALSASYAEEGQAADAGQRFGEAVEAYAMAYALDPSAAYLFNAGQAARHGGQGEVALVLYLRLLKDHADFPDRKAAAAHVVSLRASVKPARPASRLRTWTVGVAAAAAGIAIGLGVGLGIGLGRRQQDPATDGGFARITF